MSRKSKITDSQYKLYVEYLRQGLSKAAACRNLGIPTSTMYDYVKRLEGQPKKTKTLLGEKGFFDGIKTNEETHPFAYLVHPQKYIFIVYNELYYVDLNSSTYTNKKQLFDQLVSKKDNLKLSEFEFNELKKLKIKSTTSSIIEVLSEGNIEKAPKSKNEILEFNYKGFKISEYLYKILEAAANKSDTVKLKKFLDLLIKNPDLNVVHNLYDFLSFNDIEICDNGYILAYKGVSDDFKDIRTGKFDNSVGKYVEEDRKLVDNNPKAACSRGLHVGSLDYINQIYNYNCYRIVACIINPEDVVSVPDDYNGAKMRVCKYKVVKVHR